MKANVNLPLQSNSMLYPSPMRYFRYNVEEPIAIICRSCSVKAQADVRLVSFAQESAM